MIASALVAGLPQTGNPTFAATTTTASSEAHIIMNGIIRNNSTLTPLRQLAESLGFTVEWHEENRSITVVKDGKTIQLTLNQPAANVNGKPVALDIPPLLHRDLTVVPVRFISEAFGATVQWDNEHRRVIINDRITIVMEPNDEELKQMIITAANGHVGDPNLRPLINYVSEDTITMKTLITADSSNSGDHGYATYTFTRSSTGWSIAIVDIERSKDIDFQINENEAIYLSWRTTTDTIVKAHGSYAFSSANNNMEWSGGSFMFITETPKGEYRTVLVNTKTGRTADFAGFKHNAPQIAKTLGP
jgi:hypothetical protein